MSDPANLVIQNCDYYLRVVTIFQVCLKKALLDILHDPAYNGLPLNNEHHTHGLLLAFKTKEEKNLRHVLKPWQWDIICHVCTNTCAANCQRAGKTSTQDFDITIICVLLSNYLVGLPPPTNGSKKPLAPGDYSKGSCGIRARDLRNKTTGHGSYLDISTKQEFDDCCSEIEKILKGLGYKDMKLFEDLKTSSLDSHIPAQIEFLVNSLKADQNVKKMEIDNINFTQVKMKASLDEISAKQVAMENRQTAMETEQTEMELKSNPISLIVEELKDKLFHLEQKCDRRYIETTSIAIDKNQENLKLVSDGLKKKFKKKYGAMCLSLKPRKTSFEPVKQIERKNIVVKLSMFRSRNVFETEEDNEHTKITQSSDGYGIEHQNDLIETTHGNQNDMDTDKGEEHNEIMQENNKDPTSSSFTYKDIFESHDDYVLISGDPGYGKTTLVETILHEWSINELWKEKFEFVFIIYFRQLVKFSSDQTITCQKLLSHFYPGFDFSMLSNHKTLLILDGFDEFACKEDFRKKTENFSPFVQAVYDLVDPNNPSIQFTRLLTSRPGSFPVLFKSVFNASFEQNLRIFKITGFDDQNIEQYIYNHLQNANLSKNFLMTLQRTPILKNFMRIPFFCWGICYLINNKEISLDKLPVTTSAIYANILTLFIRNHGLRNPASKLLSLFKLKEFQEMISMLSNMAWILYDKSKIIFSSNDLKEFGDINLLIQSGLVIKVESEHGEIDHFQFMHYSFQEFLCALHVFYEFKDVSDSNSSDNMKIMIAGLCGGKLQNSSSDTIVKSFASMKPSCCKFASIFYRPSSFHCILNEFYEFQNQTENIHIPYLAVDADAKFNDEDRVESIHFIKRFNDNHFSVGIFYIDCGEFYEYLEPVEVDVYDSEPGEVDVLTAIMRYSTTLECSLNMLQDLNRNVDFGSIKEGGRMNSLYIHAYSDGTGFEDSFDYSKVLAVLKKFTDVKILVATGEGTMFLNMRLAGFAVSIGDMIFLGGYPISCHFYFASLDQIKYCKYEAKGRSILDIGVFFRRQPYRF